MLDAATVRRFRQGSEPPPGGTRKGQPNKIPHAVKEMVLAALMAKGGQKYLEEQVDKNPVAFMALLGKIRPL